jgi:predicted CoA-substrate-specific enzyme activase
VLYGGIDVGSLTAQAVLFDGQKIKAYKSIRVKPHPVLSAEAVMGALLEEIKLNWQDMKVCVSTGYGRETLQEKGLAHKNVSEISCHGKGAQWLAPGVRTIIDVGGQDAKVIKVDSDGELVDFVMNDKCAAGTGRFLEVMAQTLGVELEELGPLALRGRNVVSLTNRCSIYCQTEVIDHLSEGIDRADLAYAVNKTMSERVLALVRRLGGINKELTITGGVAKNVAVRKELEVMTGARLVEYKADSQIVGALGAAIIASLSNGGRP